jgi:hypothetical protein
VRNVFHVIRNGVFLIKNDVQYCYSRNSRNSGSPGLHRDEGPDQGERSNLALLKQRMNMEKEVSFTGLRRQAGLVGKDVREYS